MPVPTFRRKQENSRLATNPSILISDTEQLIRFEAGCKSSVSSVSPLCPSKEHLRSRASRPDPTIGSLLHLRFLRLDAPLAPALDVLLPPVRPPGASLFPP